MTTDTHHRLEERARAWGVTVGHIVETDSSLLAFGYRGSESVALKVIKQPGDEWKLGEVLSAFQGNGVVRAYEYVEGAVLLERLNPGSSLVAFAVDGRDDEATDILADVVGRMRGCEPPKNCATVQEWAKGFELYAATGDSQIPMHLVDEGRRWYLDLCVSQREPHLLHGDLHHYNVLFDSGRGWLAIDPKGVVGETEYEIGAALRNPFEAPDLFTSPLCLQKRLERFSERLNLDFNRVVAWAFAQAVLSAIWEIEDGSSIGSTNPALRLAYSIQPMLNARR